MKVKKIACLLTALVISASAAMVPAVANAKAGDSVTVSSTTSYEEGDSTSATDVSSAKEFWEAEDGSTDWFTDNSVNGRFFIGGKGQYTVRLKHDGEVVDDCKIQFRARIMNSFYLGFKLSDDSLVTAPHVSNDNGAKNLDVTVIIKKNGTSSITMSENGNTLVEYEYSAKDGTTIKDFVVSGDGTGSTGRYVRIYPSSSTPFTVTQLKETTETVTATEAEKYTEDDVTDKIGFYGNANVNGASRINWYASNGSEWVEGDFDAPTVTAENADVTFGLIIEGTDAATAIQSAAYRLD